MWKVGDKVTRVGGIPGAPRQEGTIVFIAEDYKDVVLVRTEHGINLWNVARILPPPPTVAFESWVNVYGAYAVSGHRTKDHALTLRNGTAETIHIYKLSNGTWHIERV